MTPSTRYTPTPWKLAADRKITPLGWLVYDGPLVDALGKCIREVPHLVGRDWGVWYKDSGGEMRLLVAIAGHNRPVELTMRGDGNERLLDEAALEVMRKWFRHTGDVARPVRRFKTRKAVRRG